MSRYPTSQICISFPLKYMSFYQMEWETSMQSSISSAEDWHSPCLDPRISWGNSCSYWWLSCNAMWVNCSKAWRDENGRGLRLIFYCLVGIISSKSWTTLVLRSFSPYQGNHAEGYINKSLVFLMQARDSWLAHHPTCMLPTLPTKVNKR